jgi:UDP-N-acetylmuramate--alanine ligase
MKLEQIHIVHFLGIGGIGMSAIARWFNSRGVVVSGYDKTPSPLTEALQQEGMEIQYVDDLDFVPEAVKNTDPAHVLVVWTPAMPKDSVTLNFFLNHNYLILKRAKVLGLITSDMPTVAAAGTHGKTTTSSMVAHLLKQGEINVTAFLGGITQNYQSNMLLADDPHKEAVVVVEADEFDRSFLQLHPNIAILTSVDPDHLDIYGNDLEMKESFKAFVNLIPASGKLFIHENAYSRLSWDNPLGISVVRYGINSLGITAKNIRALSGSFIFDYENGDQEIKDLEINMPGFHNVENALPSIAIALEMGISEEKVKEALQSFKGVKRRFEVLYNDGNQVYIDDYAHHPEEIKAFLGSVKAMFPKKKLTVIFQPHLYTRTRDFAEGFSASLSLADEVFLLEIYPARELPIPGVTSEMLMEKITSSYKILLSKEDLVKKLEEREVEVLVTIGAGDIDRLVLPLLKWISQDEK